MPISCRKFLLSSKKFFSFASARLLPAILNLFAIPIILQNSGAGLFGLITVILALTSIQVLVDLGLINSFLPVFVKKLHNKELREAQEIYVSTIVRIVLYSSLFSALSLPFVKIFLQHRNSNESMELNGQFAIAIYIVLFSNILGGLVSLTNRILIVFQKNRLSSVLNSISNSLVILLMVLCSFMNAPIIPMTLAIVFIPIFISISTLVWISGKNDLLNFRNFSWKVSDFGLATQLGNWIVQVSAIFSVQFDTLIMALYNDSSEVARYGVISKVFLLLVTIYSWTTAHETVETIHLGFKGKIAEAHQEFLRFFWRLLILTFISIVPLSISLKTFFPILTSGKLNFTYFEIAIAVFWCFSLLLVTKISRILFAEGVFRGYFQISMFGSAVNVAATFWFCSQGLGFVGPLLATILSTFLVFLPLYFYAIRKF